MTMAHSHFFFDAIKFVAWNRSPIWNSEIQKKKKLEMSIFKTCKVRWSFKNTLFRWKSAQTTCHQIILVFWSKLIILQILSTFFSHSRFESIIQKDVKYAIYCFRCTSFSLGKHLIVSLSTTTTTNIYIYCALWCFFLWMFSFFLLRLPLLTDTCQIEFKTIQQLKANECFTVQMCSPQP